LKLVVLASGGLDSSLMMFLLKEEGHEIYPLHINYGQLAEEREWQACTRICDFLSIVPVRMDISGFGKLVRSGITDPSLDVYEEAFLPTRNLTFLTLGGAYAYSKSIDIVAIGLLSNPIFPDQTKESVQCAETSISSSLGTPIHFLTPLIELDKRDILKLAKKTDLLQITYYCHSGEKEPCGKCISCKERISAEEYLRG
jgi:7-cyano-7-deazaguanine synthase